MAFGISAFHNDGTHFVIPRVQAAFRTRSTQQAVKTKDIVESVAPKDASNIESKRKMKQEKAAKRKRDSTASQIDEVADDEHQSQQSKTKIQRRESTESYEPAIKTKGNNENRRPLEAVIIPAMDSSKIFGKKRKRPNGISPTRRDTLQSMESFGEPTDVDELDVGESHGKKKKRKISEASSLALDHVNPSLKETANLDIDSMSIDESSKKEKHKKHEHREEAVEVEAALAMAAQPLEVIVIGEQPKTKLSKGQRKRLRKQEEKKL